MKLEFSWQIFYLYSNIPNFTTIHPAEDELFHGER